MKQELGFAPASSSAEAMMDCANGKSRGSRSSRIANRKFDDFGLDKDYIAAYGRTLFKLLHNHYWRVEVDGLERVPREGRAVMVGVHRGLMPWEGVMALHLLAQKLGRSLRFLFHQTLIRFPLLCDFFP